MAKFAAKFARKGDNRPKSLAKVKLTNVVAIIELDGEFPDIGPLERGRTRWGGGAQADIGGNPE
jgi:hypothetical protein